MNGKQLRCGESPLELATDAASTPTDRNSTRAVRNGNFQSSFAERHTTQLNIRIDTTVLLRPAELPAVLDAFV